MLFRSKRAPPPPNHQDRDDMSTSTSTSQPSSSASTTATPQHLATQIKIRLPTPTEHQNPAFLHQTTKLINTAYSAPATTLLKPNNSRTNTKEVQTWLKSGNFFLAFACNPPSSPYSSPSSSSSSSSNNSNNTPDQQQDHPVGTIRLAPLSPTISEIGILTVDPIFRSSGLGRMLIAYAEGLARKGGAERMRIEVPSPMISSSEGAGAQGRVTSSKKKKYLRRWYESLGYEIVGRRPLEECVPGLVESFEEEVEILVLEKILGGG
jgi:hypothetical protein